jgi:hypothetical protein
MTGKISYGQPETADKYRNTERLLKPNFFMYGPPDCRTSVKLGTPETAEYYI